MHCGKRVSKGHPGQPIVERKWKELSSNIVIERVIRIIMETKRDLSISMARANIIVMFVSIPVAILQFSIVVMLHETIPRCT